MAMFVIVHVYIRKTTHGMSLIKAAARNPSSEQKNHGS
jgi:hypothetical protein